LILDGALDNRTEADLAAQLNVSARHLRRLFVEHLGVTPGGLARSARTHFARRLLDDTDLSILEIAFATGFGSVRQLNRACREVFRMAPRELRARRRASDRLVADGGLLLRLPFVGGLDWTAMLRYFAARAIPGVESVTDNVYRRTIVINGDPGVLELRPGDAEHLLVRAHLPHWRELMHIVQRARHIASLDVDLDEPLAQLQADPAIGHLVQARPGVRVPGTWDGFETGVRTIIGQKLSECATNTATGRLVERVGVPVEGVGQLGLSHTFPSPAAVAVADLADLGIAETRADAVRRFAEGVVTGDVVLDRSVSTETFVSSLTAIRGIGPRTAHYIALRLGEPDAFPVGEGCLERLLARHAHAQRIRPRSVSEGWRPWRALATTHLWLCEEAEQSTGTHQRAA